MKRCLWRYLGLLILLLSSSLALAVPPARSQALLAPVAESRSEVFFGQYIRFYLDLTASEPIASASLFVTAPGLGHTSTTQTRIAFPNETIQLVLQVEAADLALSPFTEVTYWWEITASSGASIVLPDQRFIYDDTRFEWQNMTREGISVSWLLGDTDFGQQAWQAASSALMEMAPLLPHLPPVGLENPLRIYIYPSASELRRTLNLSGYDWVGGHADPAAGVVLVAIPDNVTAPLEIARIVPHEVAHVRLYQAAAPHGDNISVWFDEGLASLFEQASLPDSGVMLEKAVADEALIPLGELCLAFPADGEASLLAYAQSRAIVSYMQQAYGNYALTELVLAHAGGARCEGAVRQVLGLSLAELEKEWRQSLVDAPFWQQVWEKGGLWLLLGLVGFVLPLVVVFTPLRRRTEHQTP